MKYSFKYWFNSFDWGNFWMLIIYIRLGFLNLIWKFYCYFLNYQCLRLDFHCLMIHSMNLLYSFAILDFSEQNCFITLPIFTILDCWIQLIVYFHLSSSFYFEFLDFYRLTLRIDHHLHADFFPKSNY